MAGEYFQKFPRIVYNNTIAANIIARVRLKDELKKYLSTYYYYDVKSGERPDNVAESYYKRANLSWLIFFANDTVDPLLQWHKDTGALESFIASKYGSVDTALSKIAFYRVNWVNDKTKLTQTSYDLLPASRKRYWDRSLSTDQGDESFWKIEEDKRDYTKSVTYERAKLDIVTETNKIIKITYTQTSGNNTIEEGDIVRRYSGGALVAAGEIVSIGTNTLTLKNIQESGDGFNPSNSYTFEIRNKNNILTVTEKTLLSTTIPDNEVVYWESVTYYAYETELNDARGVITLLDNRYAQQAERDLRVLLS